MINDLNNKISENNNLNENKMENFEKNKKIENNIFNSKINIDEYLVNIWLNERKFKAALLFRMSEDGVDFNTFHKKCDNKGETIIFIETENGYRFGGYTELDWDNYSNEKTDESTFLFSFNYKEKYIRRNDKYSIGCYHDSGPKFGWGPQIYFSYNLIEGRSSNSKDNTFILNNKFVDGKSEWKTKELEVFQIKYN